NPWVASLTAAVAFLLVAATVGSIIFSLVLIEEGKAKEKQRAAAVEARKQADENRELAEKKADEAEKARKLADASARLATEQSNVSLQTLHGLVTSVQEKLRDKPDMNDLRQGLLKYAMDGMDRVAGKSADTALGMRILGGVHQRKGDLLLQLGKSEQALK